MRELRIDLPDLLTSSEVAMVFGVSPKTVWRWAKASRLSSIRTLGGHRRYLKSDVQAALNEGFTPAGQGAAYPNPGSEIPGQPGYVVATCTHRIAESEWAAGFRTCERCPASERASGEEGL